MNKKFVIRSISSGGYFDGGKNFVSYMLSKEYNSADEAETVVKDVLPKGVYSIDRVFIKL